MHIIKKYGTRGEDSDEKRLQNYNEKLQRFCECSVFELPRPESGNGADNMKKEKLYVKLNTVYTG